MDMTLRLPHIGFDMLRGLRSEIEKIDRLANYSYLRDKILLPALRDAQDKTYITVKDATVLKATLQEQGQELQSASLLKMFPEMKKL